MGEFVYHRFYIDDKNNRLTDYETPLFLFFYEAIDYATTTAYIHKHPFTEIFYIIKGEGAMHYQDKVVPLRQNELHIIPPNVNHCEVAAQNGEPLTFFVINVDNKFPFYKSSHKLTLPQIIRHVFPSDDNFVFCLFKKIAEELRSQPQPQECAYRIELALSQLYVEIARLLAPPQFLPSPSENNISYVLRYIIEHYAEDISLETLSKVMHMSTVQLGKIFKKTYKMTPMQYLTNERIFHAKQLLRETNDSVTEISLKVGYNSPAYFTAVFRKSVGQTPSEYKRFLG